MKREAVFLHRKYIREGIAALLAAVCVLTTSAYAPAPRAAWWCTAFSITGGETAPQSGTDKIELRFALADCLRALLG